MQTKKKVKTQQIAPGCQIYQLPKKINDLKEHTAFLNRLKTVNPHTEISVIAHNGIYVVVVHWMEYCFHDSSWNLHELELKIFLEMIYSLRNDARFLQPKISCYSAG